MDLVAVVSVTHSSNWLLTIVAILQQMASPQAPLVKRVDAARAAERASARSESLQLEKENAK